MSDVLRTRGFQQSKLDPTLWYLRDGATVGYLSLYVDDGF